MGMSDRQFDTYQSKLLWMLKKALLKTPENDVLEEIVDEIETDLKRP